MVNKIYKSKRQSKFLLEAQSCISLFWSVNSTLTFTQTLNLIVD